MGYNATQVRSAIINKWDWQNPINNVPILVWGPPGVGKTWVIMSIIAERKLNELEFMLKTNTFLDDYNADKCINHLNRLKSYTNPDEVMDILHQHSLIMRLAERPIEQIEGVPAPNFNEGYTRFLMPENLIYLKKARWVVVFLDELDKASPAKMASVTHLIENLTIGDFKLPLDTFVIAAANRTQDSFLSKPVSPELCNRMAHIEMDADVKTWTPWAANHGVSTDIINFHKFNLMRNENYLFRYNHNDNEASSPRAFSSPRSWFYGSKLRQKVYDSVGAKFGEDAEIDNMALMELEQLVGESSAIELITYLKLYSKIDIKKILSGEQTVPKLADAENMPVDQAEAIEPTDKLDKGDKKSNKRSKRESVMAEQYIYAFAIIEQLNEDLLSKHNAMYNLVAAISNMMPEIRAVFVQTFNASNKKLLRKIANHKEAEKLVDEIISYLAD